ncbi:hypothetical protein M0813_09880 [Anaeramoeba flamelloides]|uniref:VWFA domain-containing protein n=1 Tax=Anaeramoeba flamelloides TaxID=1746091 RepID=A0ABQ8X5A3_9EUKA|nr:hypothetical protein M0813_09880 [Anaeramoeba flamelloides]
MEFKANSYLLNLDETKKIQSLTLNLEKTGQKQDQVVPCTIFFVLDRSGSMAGKNFRDAKESICHLYDKLWDQDHIHLELITYNHYAIAETVPSDLNEAKKHLMNFRAGGTTNFTAAFDALSELLSRYRRKRDFYIIFFTDGNDIHDQERGKPQVHSSMLQLQQWLFEKGSCSEVHSIGFTPDHDAILMNEIAQIGSAQGSFSYVKESSEIENTVSNIISLIQASSSISGELILNSQFNQIIYFERVDQEKNFEMKRMMDMSENEKKDFKLKVGKSQTNQETIIQGLKKKRQNEYLIDKKENEKENEKEYEKEKEREKENEKETEKEKEKQIEQSNERKRKGMEIELVNERETEYFISDLFLQTISEEDLLSIKITCGEIQQVIEIHPKVIEEPHVMKKLELTLQYIRREVMSMTNSIVDLNTSEEELKQMKIDIDQYDELLNKKRVVLYKMKKKERSEIMPQIQDLKEYIGKFHELLSRALSKKFISNDQIATLNSLAYRSIAKSRLKKQLNKRIEKNIKLFQEIDDKIEKIVSKIDFEKLKEQEKESIGEIGNCYISTNSWIEALEYEDCLCLGIDIGRNENVIADPSQLVIKEIFSSIISAQAYLDSVEFALKNVSSAGILANLGSSQVWVHGGFNSKNSGEVVKGQHLEKITGVIPLYICEQNWKVARLKVKPLFGFMTTLDTLGYSYSQIATIPFLVLSKAAEKVETEFEKKRFGWILDTCKHIYLDSKQLREEIISKYNTFLKDPLARLKGSIPNNSLFLAQCVVALRVGDIQILDNNEIIQFSRRIIEEEFRRRQPRDVRQLPQTKIIDLCIELLNLDYDALVKAPLEKFEKRLMGIDIKNNQYSNKVAKFKEKLKNANKWDNEDEKRLMQFQNKLNEKTIKGNDFDFDNSKIALETFKSPTFTVEINKYRNSKQFLSKNSYLFTKYICPMMQILKKFWLNEEDQPKLMELKDFGIENDKIFFEMLLQNLFNIKNSILKSSIEGNRYMNIWENPNSFIKSFVNNTLEITIKVDKNKIINRFNKMNYQNVAKAFALTNNLVYAAALLDGTKLGVNVGYFINALHDYTCPFILEKLKMLLDGHFRGVPIFVDKKSQSNKNNQFVKWVPSKKKFHKIYKKSKTIGSPQIWKELFPKFAYIIDKNLDYEKIDNDPLNRRVYNRRKRKKGKINGNNNLW